MFSVYVVRRNCAKLHNFFFFMMDYGENGYVHSKMSKNDWKLIIGGLE